MVRISRYWKSLLPLLALTVVIVSCSRGGTPVTPPAPADPVPTNYSLAWKNVGETDFSGPASNLSLKVYSGVPYVAYISLTDNKAYVMKYVEANASWEKVGEAEATESTVSSLSMAIDSTGNIYIAYADADNGDVPRARMFSALGSAWSDLGISISAKSAAFISSDIFGDVFYVAYREEAGSNPVTVKKYNSVGSSWDQVGAAGFSDGDVQYVSLHIFDDGANGVPYVAYMDEAHGNKITVMNFDGVGWSPVGATGFSDGEASYVTVAVDKNGVPYVSYRDASLLKAVSMKYNAGSNVWKAVGSNGVSDGDAAYVSMFVYNTALNTAPIICYQDAEHENKLTTKIGDGTAWFAMGLPGLSNNPVKETSIFVYDANSFVAYIEDATDEIKVEKF
ncbi:MAG: hypothetical protein WCQ53_06360 [bacterium]